MSNPIFYRRNLPHYQPSDGWYLANIRLADSLPKEAHERIQQEFEDYKRALAATPPSSKKTVEYRERQFKYFIDFDKLLHDYANSPAWLSQNDVAQIVADTIHYSTRKNSACSRIALCQIMFISFSLSEPRALQNTELIQIAMTTGDFIDLTSVSLDCRIANILTNTLRPSAATVATTIKNCSLISPRFSSHYLILFFFLVTSA